MTAISTLDIYGDVLYVGLQYFQSVKSNLIVPINLFTEQCQIRVKGTQITSNLLPNVRYDPQVFFYHKVLTYATANMRLIIILEIHV